MCEKIKCILSIGLDHNLPDYSMVIGAVEMAITYDGNNRRISHIYIHVCARRYVCVCARARAREYNEMYTNRMN